MGSLHIWTFLDIWTMFKSFHLKDHDDGCACLTVAHSLQIDSPFCTVGAKAEMIPGLDRCLGTWQTWQTFIVKVVAKLLSGAQKASRLNWHFCLSIIEWLLSWLSLVFIQSIWKSACRGLKAASDGLTSVVITWSFCQSYIIITFH